MSFNMQQMKFDETGAKALHDKITLAELDETTSTNDFLKRQSVPDGTGILVATARYQTAGRGQGTNRWESERGKNLLFSILVRPVSVPVSGQFVLSMACALALTEALQHYAGFFTLKWPNDIYWHDSKISGTLIETSVSGHTLSRCIFGIGLNVNQRNFRSDAPNPVSLSSILGHEVPLREVLDAVLREFCKYYAMVEEGRYDEVARLYNASLYRRDGFHTYRDANGLFTARISRVGLDGRLYLALPDGMERSYAFKEVAFVLKGKAEMRNGEMV